MKKNLNIVVFGGSGDLAERKIFPALFSLYGRKFLPENVHFFAFARSILTHKMFRHKISTNLACRYNSEDVCDEQIKKFLSSCYYISGGYDMREYFCELLDCIKTINDKEDSEFIFYFAVPSSVFIDIASNLNAAMNGRISLENAKLVIEKPFGQDRESSDILTERLLNSFKEEQIYRIDHYLGKEMVQNLLVLRFANQFLEPLWNSRYIEKIELLWTEDRGIYGRGKYFDKYGIIRDVMQNHLLQILALVAMEEPASLRSDDIRNCKVEVLKVAKIIAPENVQTGQYSGAIYKGAKVAGYIDDPSIPNDSLTPTFARIPFEIDNDRWHGTQFVMTAGQGMEESKAEIHIKFKSKHTGIFCDYEKCPLPNELIIRIQPNEGFHFKITTKTPGNKLAFTVKDLDLSYNRVFDNLILPDAYENLLLDIIAGKSELFVRDDELRASWDVIMPVLDYLESKKIEPEDYPFGTNGPEIFQTT